MLTERQYRLQTTDCLYEMSTVRLIGNEQLIVYVKHRKIISWCVCNNWFYLYYSTIFIFLSKTYF